MLQNENNKKENEIIELGQKYSICQDEYNKLKDSHEALNISYQSITKELNNFQDENSSKQKYIQDLLDKINLLEADIRSNNDNQQELNEKYISLEQKTNEQIKVLESDNNSNQEKIKDQQEAIEKFEQECQLLKFKNINLEEQIGGLKKFEDLLINMNKIVNENKDKPWFYNEIPAECEDVITQYDLKLNLNLSKKYNKEIFEVSHDVKDDSVLHGKENTFCIIGSYQTGKTFVLSSLVGLNIPVGKKFPTLDLVIRKVNINGKNYFCIDTPGANKPKAESTIEFSTAMLKNDLMDRIATELSDFIILVVNNFTIHEQKYLDEMINKPNIKKKNFIIIHNIKDIDTDEGFKHFWDAYIKNSIALENPGGIKYRKVKKFVDNKLEKYMIPFYIQKKNIIHHVLINNFTNFGKALNALTIEAIRNFIENNINDRDDDLNLQQSLDYTLKTLIDPNYSVYENNIFSKSALLKGIKWRNMVWIQNPTSKKRNVEFLVDQCNESQINELIQDSERSEVDEVYCILINLPGVNRNSIIIKCSSKCTKVIADKKIYSGPSKEVTDKDNKLVYRFVIPEDFDHINPTAKLRDGQLQIRYKAKFSKHFKLADASRIRTGEIPGTSVKRILSKGNCK